MSAAAVFGIVLTIGFVGVALVASIAWRKRMQESMPFSDAQSEEELRTSCRMGSWY